VIMTRAVVGDVHASLKEGKKHWLTYMVAFINTYSLERSL
jgi:hypothetical protein